MKGGEISGNTADSNDGYNGGGGGIYVGGTFTMAAGDIYGNFATSSQAGGGGVYSYGTFTMTGGTISGNTSSSTYKNFGGGGVYIVGQNFTKTGGTIYGASGENNDNRAIDGYAVLIRDRGLRNNIAGPEVKLDASKTGTAGGWEN